MRFSWAGHILGVLLICSVSVGSAHAYSVCIAKASSVTTSGSTDIQGYGYVTYNTASGATGKLHYVAVCAKTSGTNGGTASSIAYGSQSENVYCWQKIVAPFSSDVWVNHDYVTSGAGTGLKRNNATCEAYCTASIVYSINTINKILQTLYISRY